MVNYAKSGVRISFVKSNFNNVNRATLMSIELNYLRLPDYTSILKKKIVLNFEV